MKYLYRTDRRGDKVHRVKVYRETDHNIWYERHAGGATIRIHKRTMIEDGWTAKYWEADNERLETLYQAQRRRIVFDTKLEELAEAYESSGVYEAVMSIDVSVEADNAKEAGQCGECDAFTDEDADGRGWCALNDRETGCGDGCKDFNPVTTDEL